MLPTGAALSRRAATFTASPSAVYSFLMPTGPSMAGPVLTPMRIFSAAAAGWPAISFQRSTSTCSSSAACTACSASSSRTVCTPHSAIKASPICLSTSPPRARMIPSRRSQSELRKSATSSTSSVSLRAVKPEISANRMLTVLRCCPGGPAGVFSASSFARKDSSAVSTSSSPRAARWLSSRAMACSREVISVTRVESFWQTSCVKIIIHACRLQLHRNSAP